MVLGWGGGAVGWGEGLLLVVLKVSFLLDLHTGITPGRGLGGAYKGAGDQTVSSMCKASMLSTVQC